VAGAVLMAALLAAALLIFFLGEIRRGLRSTYSLVAVLPDAHGLRPGVAVWLAGRPSGDVTAVELLAPAGNDTLAQVAVTLELRSGVRELIRADSDARMRRQRLMGDPVIAITVGSAGARILAPGDTLRTRATLPPAALLNATDRLQRRAAAAADDLVTLRALLDDRPAFDAARAELALARREVETLRADLATGPLGAFLRDPAARAGLDRARLALDSVPLLAAARLTGPEAAELEAALAAISLRIERLREEAETLRALLDEPTAGFPGRFAHDTAIAVAYRGVLVQIDSLLAEARRNPLRFLF
jgi:hypothetical protein